MSFCIKNCWKYQRVLENLKGCLSNVYVEVVPSFGLAERLEKAIYVEMTYICTDTKSIPNGLLSVKLSKSVKYFSEDLRFLEHIYREKYLQW